MVWSYEGNFITLWKSIMKIAMLSEWREPIIWWQVYAKYLCDFLVRNHHCSVDLFTRSFITEEWKKIQGDTVYSPWWNVIRIGPIWSFFNPLKRVCWLVNMTRVLYQAAKKNKYDIIHAHAILAWLPAWIVGKILRIPVVYTVHGTMHMDTWKKGIFYYAEKFFVSWLPYDLMISVSHRVLQHNPRAKKKVIIYPGIDVASHHLDIAQKIKKNPGMSYLFVGRMDWQKWLSYLFDAMSRISHELLDARQFHLTLVGDWPDASELKRQLLLVWREKYVTFLWKMPFEQAICEYPKHTLFILPSLAEWQPVVVLEALLHKLPVIVTDVGDNKYVVWKDLGWIVPPWDAIALQETIEKTLQMDMVEIEGMGEKWYTEVVEHYQRQKIVQAIFTEYQTLLKSK